MTTPGADSTRASLPTASRDYYEGVLGVPHDADAAQVKAAFRDLASKYHPDRNKAPDATSRFRAVAEAYAALSSEDRPARPEPERIAAPCRGTQRAGARWLSPEDLWAGVDVQAIFGERTICLHRGSGNPTPARTREVASKSAGTRPFTSDNQASPRGGESLRARHGEERPGCGGSEFGRRPRECAHCGGTGEVIVYERHGNVLFQRTVSCTACDGKGQFAGMPGREHGGR